MTSQVLTRPRRRRATGHGNQPGAGRRGALAPGVGVPSSSAGPTPPARWIVEHPFEVGALLPPHIHTLEDEFSIVLEGEIGFRSNEQEVVLGPGGYIVKPRGEVHAMGTLDPSPGCRRRWPASRTSSTRSST